VTGLVNASSVFQVQGTNVLSEVACEKNGKCNVDQKSFKGIASRSFARAALAAPFTADSLQKTLQASAKGAAKFCEGSGNDLSCGLKWYEDSSELDSVLAGGLGEVFSSLEVIQALLYPQAKSTGGTNGGAAGNSTNPAASASGKPSPSATGSAAGAAQTGAAGKMEVAWAITLISGFAALLI
jgi:mannan endo-1,6-alpha-mannosidase